MWYTNDDSANDSANEYWGVFCAFDGEDEAVSSHGERDKFADTKVVAK
jgi:hypothetical protein